MSFFFKHTLGKGQVTKKVFLIVLFLIYLKHHTGRVEFILIETFRRIDHTHFGSGPRGVDFDGVAETASHIEEHGQTYSGDTIVQYVCVEDEPSCSIEYAVYFRTLGKMLVHTHQGYHGLLTTVTCQGFVFEHGTGPGHIAVFSDGLNKRGIGSKSFAFYGQHLQLRVERSEARSHQFLKTVEHREHAHQCRCRHGHPQRGDERNDVDGMVTLF